MPKLVLTLGRTYSGLVDAEKGKPFDADDALAVELLKTGHFSLVDGGVPASMAYMVKQAAAPIQPGTCPTCGFVPLDGVKYDRCPECAGKEGTGVPSFTEQPPAEGYYNPVQPAQPEPPADDNAGADGGAAQGDAQPDFSQGLDDEPAKETEKPAKAGTVTTKVSTQKPASKTGK